MSVDSDRVGLLSGAFMFSLGGGRDWIFLTWRNGGLPWQVRSIMEMRTDRLFARLCI